jgi:DNA (cytosine-5)-methyltransferase 1
MKSLLEILNFIENCEHLPLFVCDLFCGAGGTSTGIERAVVKGEKAAKVVVCINHDTNAILSHEANHKNVLHFIEDIRTFDLTPAIAVFDMVRKYHTQSKTLLHASLECTNFSKAKGGKSRDADSRTLAEHLFRYIEAIRPDYIQIENVEEFMSWGDLDANGKPVSRDKGRLYRKWVNKVKGYGYNFDYRILNAADYGAYTSRKRFFGQFARRGLPIVWPDATHAKKQTSGQLKKWKPVRMSLIFQTRAKAFSHAKNRYRTKRLSGFMPG